MPDSSIHVSRLKSKCIYMTNEEKSLQFKSYYWLAYQAYQLKYQKNGKAGFCFLSILVLSLWNLAHRNGKQNCSIMQNWFSINYYIFSSVIFGYLLRPDMSWYFLCCFLFYCHIWSSHIKWIMCFLQIKCYWEKYFFL